MKVEAKVNTKNYIKPETPSTTIEDSLPGPSFIILVVFCIEKFNE